jgi:hypothetical protein
MAGEDTKRGEDYKTRKEADSRSMSSTITVGQGQKTPNAHTTLDKRHPGHPRRKARNQPLT